VKKESMVARRLLVGNLVEVWSMATACPRFPSMSFASK
jgi:hypothetical protein